MDLKILKPSSLSASVFELVGYSTVAQYIGTDITISYPPGTKIGDVAIVAFSWNEDEAETFTNATWTEIAKRTGYNSLIVFSKTITSLSDEVFDTGENGDMLGMAGIMAVYSNAINPSSSNITITGSNGSGNIDPPSHSTFATDDIAIAIGSMDDENITSVTAPTGYTMIGFIQNTDTRRNTVMMAYKEAPLSTENPSTFGVGGLTDPWNAATMSISPS